MTITFLASAFSIKFLDMRLSKEDRATVLKVADELVTGLLRSQSFVDKMIVEWKKTGATVAYLSPEEQSFTCRVWRHLPTSFENKNPTFGSYTQVKRSPANGR